MSDHPRPFLTDDEITRRIRRSSKDLGDVRTMLAPMRDEDAAAAIDGVRVDLDELADEVFPPAGP